MTIINFLFGCDKKHKSKTDNEIFEEILNDPHINSKEVGEREGIKYFQVMENGKTGFRDLDGNIVIEPKFDAAEMFSEGFSAVQVDNKWGLINETGKYVIEPRFDYLGSVHNGLSSCRVDDKYGFVSTKGIEKIKPQFAWVGDFSEGFCVVRNNEGKHGYIDTSGKLIIEYQFEYAMPFEKSTAKIQLNNLWGKVDRTGKIIIDPPNS